MTTAKQKFYVVWSGKVPGIYLSWDKCKEQVHGVAGARFKSYPNLEAATKALEDGVPPSSSIVRKHTSAMPENPPEYRKDTVLSLPAEVSAEAWAVDAACSGNPGNMEYRGIDLQTGAVVFHFGPIWGTNNIGEFLAIVHALAILKKQGKKITIYSDSRNAILWVAKKKCNTKLVNNKRTEQVHQIVSRAENWLNNNTYDIPIKKWDTSKWGEIPADFGRK